MNFKRLDDAMATCKKHLDSTGARGTEIESFLVSHLLVAAVADYEEKLEAMMAKRAERTADGHLHSFVKAACNKMARAPSLSKIAGLLGSFGQDYKAAFSTVITNTPAHIAYDNIVTNRHAIAHKTGSLFTFTDLERDYPTSKQVLEAAANALTLTASEIALL
jgi:hypothetical protein